MLHLPAVLPHFILLFKSISPPPPPRPISQHAANVNAQSYGRNTALHAASGRGLLDALRLLVRNGADSSLKNYHNDTPLMVAKNKKVRM